MTSSPSTALLHHYPIFWTSDADEFRHAIRRRSTGPPRSNSTRVPLSGRKAIAPRLHNISILHATEYERCKGRSDPSEN